MSVREALNEMRQTYEATHTYDLIMYLQGMGVEQLEVLSMSREQMIDRLMAFEEKAAFE